MKRIYQLAVLSILLSAPCTSLLLTPDVRADPITLYVGHGKTYARIQDALNNATDGYRIYVYNGTYHEHLTISHRIDLFGEDSSITTINGSRTGTVITITAPHVNISHFTIASAGTNQTNSLIDIKASECIITDNTLRHGHTGIYLNHSDNHLIYDNSITHLTGDGLLLNDSNNNHNISYNTIAYTRNGILSIGSDANRYYHNTLTYNDHNGLFLNASLTTNTLRYNTCSHNNHSGIYLNDFTNYTTIANNTLTANHDTGLALENCSQATITGNTITQNTNYGIKIIGSHNTLQTNTITTNSKDGIYLSADDNNTITHNTITTNQKAGLRLYNSTQDWITANTIADNTQYGAYLDYFTTHNLLYNNTFTGNTINACDKSPQQNHWNITTQTATNIIGGNHTSGNYYDTYTNASQGATDANHDGIADTPYTIYADTKDHGPLLDTIPPTITTTTATPTTQTLGGTTTITTTITDNTLVTSATLTIQTPTQTLTIPLTNHTQTTYTDTRHYLTVGTYTYTITATDPRNTQTTTNHTFNIQPGTPPTLTDHSPKNATPFTTYTFTTNVTSPSAGPANLLVYANWTHNTKHANTTLTHTTGNTFTTTIQLDHSTHNLTYHYYTRDTWGNALQTPTTTIHITDTTKPHITITRHGPSYDTLPNSYTYTAKITDDSTITTATIEYWTTGQPHRTAPMDHTTTPDYYTKTIITQNSTDHLYCIINATDEAGNTNTTQAPTAKPTGPLLGVTNQPLTYNGTQSFDLDGTITTYHWTFGDGTNATGDTVQHTYDANGTYTITLTVTDNDGRNGTNTTTVSIGTFPLHLIPRQQLANLNTRYTLNLTTPFYCYDGNGDGANDSFYDPNNILTAVHHTSVTISGSPYFLLSTSNDTIPEILWNTTNDALIPVNHTLGTIRSTHVDEARQQAVVTVSVEKAAWIYLDVEDTYPNATLAVTTENRTIPSTQIWREDGHIHLLDDPSREYQLTFTDIYPSLQVTFSPVDGGLINEYAPTITISFNVPALIMTATFGDHDIKDDLVKIDDQHYIYTPPAYLDNGTYPLTIDAQALQGTGFLTKDASFIFFSYGAAPQQSFLQKYGLPLLIVSLVGGLAAVLLIMRWKGVTLDGSVYIRTRRILPFFRTVIVGPVSVHIDDDRLQKAEFYVDGALKETATSFPYTWQWTEKALFKHTLEAKVYDGEGNSVSTGPVDIYFFNPYSRLKDKEDQAGTGSER